MRTLLTVLLVSSLAQIASAQDVDVEAGLRAGFRLRQAEQNEEARQVFADLFAESNDPRALAQLALAEHALESYTNAAEHLWQALTIDHEWIERNRARLQTVVEDLEGRVVRLEVRGPEGARLSVNGEPRGALPVPMLAVAPGRVSVQVVLEDTSIFSEERSVAAGRAWALEVSAPEPDVLIEPDPEPASGAPLGPILGLATGGAITVAGVIMLVIGNSFISDVEGSEVGTMWADVRSKGDRGERLALTGVLMLGVGVAALGASLVWLLVSGDDDEDREAARWFGRFAF